MSTNQGPEYFYAEKEYLKAKTIEDKIYWLEEMIKNSKKHKGTENMLAELRTRLKKLKEKQEKAKKSGKTTKKSIKKEYFQCVLVGLPNSGKSSLLEKLTNVKPKISPYPFSTVSPEVGTMEYEGVKAQIIDIPPIGADNFDQGLVNSADCLLIVIEALQDMEKISPFLKKSKSPQIIILNKSDLLSSEQKRKLEETIKSKKINGIIISTITAENIQKLKEIIFKQMHVIRVYTKEPGKLASSDPLVLKENSKVKDVAESILKGLFLKIKETRLTGPSSKFPNQKVGLSHVCKDRDIIEFHIR